MRSKIRRSVLSVSTAIMMAAANIPVVGVSAEGDAVIILSDASGERGQTVTVTVTMDNNPGITAWSLNLDYDHDAAEIISFTEGVYEDVSLSPLTNETFQMTWFDGLAAENYTVSGTLGEVTFRIKDDAKSGTYELKLTADPNNIYNKDEQNVPFDIVSGTLTVAGGDAVLMGDVNGDGSVDLGDYSDLSKYFAEWSGYDKIVIIEAADLNKSGGADLDDLSILAKCLAEWSGYREQYLS